MEKEKKRVMVVDDEPDIRSLVRAILENNGYKVVEAVSGDDCIRKLKKDPSFDLMLLDIRMPGMTPKQVIESVQKNKKLRKLKISYLTVVEFADSIKKNLLKQKQVVDYITKPFRVGDIVARVKKAIG